MHHSTEEEEQVRKVVGSDWAKILIFLLVQTFGFGYWCARIDNQLSNLTEITAEKNHRILDRVTKAEERLTRLEAVWFRSGKD
jgi:hypothetical protein